MRLAPLLVLATPALAEPRVLADFGPTQSLVAIVMGDRGTPGLIVPQGGSPHESALRPSEAAALSEADVVVWIGPALTPWLGEALPSLAPDARVVTLLDAPGWEPLPAREGADLAPHDDDDQGPEHADADAGATDPHAWLDPAVAAAWLDPIAEALSAADPEGAAAYRANAEAGRAELLALREEVAARLAPRAGAGYAVGHDALQYFERAAGLPAAWAIAPFDGGSPAPMGVAALREAVLGGEVACVLTDPETGDAWAGTLGEGTALRSARMDPEGRFLEPGPGLYPALVRGLADALDACLS